MDFLKTFQQFTQAHIDHKKQLVVLEECQEQTYKALSLLDFNKDGKYTLLPKIALYAIGSNINDLNVGILSCLKASCYSSAEALARCSLENAINLILIVNDVTTNRSRSLLIHYLSQTKKRADHWVTYAKNDSDPKGLERAEAFVEQVAMMKHMFKQLDSSRKVPGWPDARNRFISVGMERLYHILFAPASDSIHGFSEDVFNQTLIELAQDDAVTKNAAHTATRAEKISFAYYLAANSVAIFCEAAGQLASRVNRPDVEEMISVYAEKILGVISEHESVTDFYFESRPDLPFTGSDTGNIPS
mgnify:CR=1 FL=1